MNKLFTFEKKAKEQEYKRIVNNGWDVVFALDDRMIISETENEVMRVVVAGEPWKATERNERNEHTTNI
ncbi:hypothetical protein PM729_04665 [Enterococcus mundtii]|uniref:hypothetical protein n=1 Tax=Enterococcus mundtii TaxID=53346 RepID=UPI000A354CB6|nr:hypothetical protein [Enterococcus mundtii]MDB7086981.1 hypothetical protein [Enterococcus mundtii]